MSEKMFKLCLRYHHGLAIIDQIATYFFAKDNHDAVQVAQKLLKEDNELATFFDENFEEIGEGIDFMQDWIIVAVNPKVGWAIQEILVAGLDYRTFELINNCETDPNDCDYDPSCDGIYPEDYMKDFYNTPTTPLENFLKHWGDLGNALYCFYNEEEKAYCVCVFVDGAGLLEGFGNNLDEALDDWKSRYSGWME